ncbi:unnamed protein product [Rodentolepis nana]|uniref:Trithorax group protein osa n=1 Tax=Rodentolepis nana TaxID=102285 RepID=A0A0R3TUS8_RODNA|nr:unnamed protein product [Rodentolepis nana]
MRRGSDSGGYPYRPYYPSDNGYNTQPPRYPPPMQPYCGLPSAFGRPPFNHQNYYAQSYQPQPHPDPMGNWCPQYLPPYANQGYQQPTGNQRIITPSASDSHGGRSQNRLSIWKEKCSRDPWENVKPVSVPSGGDRLVTSTVNLRHTDLLGTDFNKR